MKTTTITLLLILQFYSGLSPIAQADPAVDGIIDAHWHAMACEDGALDQVASRMEETGVVLPGKCKTRSAI